MLWTYYVVLGIGIMLGGVIGAVVACVLSAREYARQEAIIDKQAKENMDLRIDLMYLKKELENERYRHDRVQDFCVKLGEQLDKARGISYASDC